MYLTESIADYMPRVTNHSQLIIMIITSSSGVIVSHPNVSNANFIGNSTTNNEVDDEVDRDRFEKVLNDLERPCVLCIPFHYVSKLYTNIFDWNILSVIKKRIFQSKLSFNEHSVLQIICNSIIGLIFSIIIGFIVYALFIVILLEDNRQTAILFTAYIMMLSIVVLTCSPDIQCIALITFIYSTTKSCIRCLLLLYTTSLCCINGSGLNILYNFDNFHNYFTCIISLININMMIIKKFNNSPFNVLNVSIEHVINEINSRLYNMRAILSSIHLSILHLITTIQNNVAWIESILDDSASSCKNTDDVLRNLCRRFLNKAYLMCIDELSTVSTFCSHLKYFSMNMCSESSSMTDECQKYSRLIESDIKIEWKKNVTEAQMEKILNMIGRSNLTLITKFDDYYPEVTNNNDNNNNQMNDVIDSLLRIHSTDFTYQVEQAKIIIYWILFVYSFFTMIQLIIKAVSFRNSWLSNITFDNNYITQAFITQEKRAVIQGLIPTLPLIRNEANIYKKLTSFSWTKDEVSRLKKLNILHIIWIFLIIAIMMIDYAVHNALYSVASVFSADPVPSTPASIHNDYDYYGAEYDHTQTVPHHTIIKGDTFYANIVKSMISLLIPLRDKLVNIDATICQPKSNPPNPTNNAVIILLLFLIISSVLFEVYALRLCHVIMIWYYPEKSEQRASWLRAHIKNNRQLLHGLKHISRVPVGRPSSRFCTKSLLRRLLMSYPKVKAVFRVFGIRRVLCALCSVEQNPSNEQKLRENFYQCPECSVYFCPSCQLHLEHICSVCCTPLFVKDTQIDFEEYSTDEEHMAMNSLYFQRADQSRGQLTSGSTVINPITSRL
ncbi:unnamed protein product [Heterobilharzia americana]|nr:unnamed protein product [Heterobilharzia americana]